MADTVTQTGGNAGTPQYNSYMELLFPGWNKAQAIKAAASPPAQPTGGWQDFVNDPLGMNSVGDYAGSVPSAPADQSMQWNGNTLSGSGSPYVTPGAVAYNTATRQPLTAAASGPATSGAGGGGGWNAYVKSLGGGSGFGLGDLGSLSGGASANTPASSGSSGGARSGGGSSGGLQPYTVTKTHPSDAGAQAASDLTKLQDKANAENEARYQQLLALANQFGTTATQQNTDLTNNQLGSTQQSLISRGLGNTTIQDSMLAGVRRRGQQAQNAINEQTARQKADIIQNRTDKAPDMGLYASLLSRPR